jgi:hypothetical protein
MTREAWKAGMRSLTVAFPYPALDRDSAREREQLYRGVLEHLTDAQWLAAVKLAIEQEAERTFPPVARLREYAREVVAALALPAPRRSEADLETGRVIAKRGLALCQAEVAKRLGELPPLPALGETPGSKP